ncbi:DsrE family protein [Sagittula salina]|uniref:DsrE family protein n=1 Tax=Sagittula salina TaxID=2820268 RepID=A0A940S3N1_9RHOB|nr:DsrE family protein [Sagittula salina]MBP0482960.1 DsrE family protein [Sagittula salina]
MKLIKTLLVLALGILAFVPPADAQDTERYGKQKVVYHINYPGGEGDKAYKGAMRNIQNHINAVGAENVEIKVVMHGSGVDLVAHAKEDQTLQTSIGSLKSQKVAFEVCNNTLKGRNINYSDDLYDVWEDDIVPSGVAELSRLQQMGYTYIKP